MKKIIIVLICFYLVILTSCVNETPSDIRIHSIKTYTDSTSYYIFKNNVRSFALILPNGFGSVGDQVKLINLSKDKKDTTSVEILNKITKN